MINGGKNMATGIFDSKNGKVIFVCINKSYEKLSKGIKIKGRESPYDCVRKYWPIKDVEKANEADFILGVCHKEIVAVCKMDERGWRKISEDSQLINGFKNDAEIIECPNLLSRYAFSGEIVDDSPYLGMEIPSEYGFNQSRTVTYNY